MSSRTKSFVPLFIFLFCMAPLGWAGKIEDKLKNGFDKAGKSLKDKITKLQEDYPAIQRYLDEYSWKGIVEDKAHSGVAILSNLTLNGHRKAIVVKSGDQIAGEVNCFLDRNRCVPLRFYRVVIGIKGQGAQTTICNYFGVAAGETMEKFVLTAPTLPGIYEIRFRVVEHLLESNALEAWFDPKGNEPDAKTTIGLLAVKF